MDFFVGNLILNNFYIYIFLILREWKFWQFLHKRLYKIRNTYCGSQNALLSGRIIELRLAYLSFLVNCTQLLHIFDENLTKIPSSSTRFPSSFTNRAPQHQLRDWEIAETNNMISGRLGNIYSFLKLSFVKIKFTEKKPKYEVTRRITQLGTKIFKNSYPGKLSKRVLFFHNNAPIYHTQLIVSFPKDFKQQMFSHSPHSPDLTPLISSFSLSFKRRWAVYISHRIRHQKRSCVDPKKWCKFLMHQNFKAFIQR